MPEAESLYGPSACCLVTGASSGIGAAIAEVLASYGARVALVARREDRLHAVAQRVHAQGGQTLVVVADVANPAAVAAAHQRVVDAWGPVTVAFLNAGVGYPTPLRAFRATDVQRIFEANVFGVSNWIELLLPAMLRRRSGVIVGVSSLARYRGLPQNAGYCASKAALSCLLESLRVDAGTEGVQISIVEPGFVRSEMTASNNFPMPFLMETESAARVICDAVAEGQGWIRFPWQMSTAVRLMARLPAALFERYAGRLDTRARRQRS